MHGQPPLHQMRRATEQVVKMKQAIDILHAHVEATCGLFMDSVRGWEQLSRMLEGLVETQVAKGMSREQGLKSPLIHGVDEPTPENVRHVSTLGARLDACAAGGFNERALSALGVVSIYAHWEDKTRKEIADALEIELNGVRSPLFSDIRRMRNALLHAGGRIDDAKPFEVLQWFKQGDVVVLNPDRFHEVMRRLRAFPEGLHTPSWNPFPGLKP